MGAMEEVSGKDEGTHMPCIVLVYVAVGKSNIRSFNVDPSALPDKKTA